MIFITLMLKIMLANMWYLNVSSMFCLGYSQPYQRILVLYLKPDFVIYALPSGIYIEKNKRCI